MGDMNIVRRLLAATGCAAAAVTLVGLPSTAESIPTTAASLATYSQFLEVGPPPKKCAPNFTQGTIAGVARCLAVGQLCQQVHAADYTKYGFRCVLVGKRYQLTKISGTRSGKSSHPGAPVKPTPKPTPPPTHH